MSNFENRWEERKKAWENRVERRAGSGHIWTGMLLLLIGSVALLRSYVADFPRWVFSWQMLLIVLGLFIGGRHRFHGAAWFVLLLVGLTFLINDYFIETDIRQHIWPLILIAVGAFFIFRSRQSPGHNTWTGKKNQALPDDGSTPVGSNTYSQDDYVDTTSIFGGCKKNILTKDFKGGDVVNVFGGTELNLSQSDINGTAVLELTTIFGGTKLIVPSHWSVKSEAVTIFGGIEDKRQLLPPSLDRPEKILVLKGTVIFGGIDIKSF